MILNGVLCQEMRRVERCVSDRETSQYDVADLEVTTFKSLTGFWEECRGDSTQTNVLVQQGLDVQHNKLV